MPGRFVPHALLLLMIVVWGGSFVAVKHALGSLPPFSLVAARFWLALLCLLPLLLRPGSLRDLRAAARPGVVAGSALAAGYLLQTAGMNETSASMGGFLAGLIPLLAALGGWLFLGGRLGRLGRLGLALGFLGMFCLLWPDAEPRPGQDSTRGIALQILSSLSYGAHVILLSHLGRTAPPLAFALWQIAFTALVATAALAWECHDTVRLAAFDGALAFDLLYLGPLATALGIAVQARVQPKIPPMHVPLLFATQPMFAALAGWSLLGDRLGLAQLAGGAMIVLGIVITTRDRP